MSDLSKTIEIIFAGTDNVSGVVDSVSKNLSDIGGGLQDISAPFVDVAEKVAILEAAILALAAAGLKARSDIEQEATKMANALGLPTEKAEEFEDVAKRVYSSGFGGGLEESFSAVTLAAQKFSNESSEGIEYIVSSANKLSSSFGIDVSDSLSAVKTLMDNFGLSSEQAFDFVVAGYQEGLNGSGDFIDSINEYSTQFANGGAGAGQFFSVLESGFQEGMLGTDRAADAFKEFRVRIEDGSKTTQEALAQLGLGQSFVDSISSGKITAIDAFETIIQRLNDTKDSSTVMQAGVGLIGTQFEDLGTRAALSLSTTGTGIDDLAGKISNIAVDESLGTKFVSIMRTIETTITSDDLWDGIENNLKEKFDGFKKDFVAAWESLDSSDFNALLDSFDGLEEVISGIFDSAGIDLSSVEGIKAAIQDVINTVTGITNVTAGMAEIISPIIGAFSDMAREFNSWSPEAKEVIGNFLALSGAVSGIGTVLVTGGTVLGGLSSLASALSGATGVGALATTAASGIGLLATGLGVVGAAAGLIIGANSLAEWLAGVQDHGEATSEAMTKLQDNLEAYKDFSGNSALPDSIQELSGETIAAVAQFTTLKDAISDLPAEVQTDIMSTFKDEGFTAVAQKLKEIEDGTTTARIEVNISDTELIELYNRLADIPEEKQVNVKALMAAGEYQAALDLIENIPTETEIALELDKDDAEKSWQIFQVQLEDGSVVEYTVEADGSSVKKTKEDIEKELPAEKVMEIKAQVDIAKIEAATKQFSDLAEIAQTGIEWNAKIDIAQIEADSEQAKAAFESIGDAVEATAEASADMMSSLLGSWDELNSAEQFEFMNVLEDQMGIQEKLADSQIKLNDAQVEYMEARAKSLNQGQAAIQIDSTGLEPALEMIMWQILEKVQLRVNEEASSMLLGV